MINYNYKPVKIEIPKQYKSVIEKMEEYNFELNLISVDQNYNVELVFEMSPFLKAVTYEMQRNGPVPSIYAEYIENPVFLCKYVESLEREVRHYLAKYIMGYRKLRKGMQYRDKCKALPSNPKDY